MYLRQLASIQKAVRIGALEFTFDLITKALSTRSGSVTRLVRNVNQGTRSFGNRLDTKALVVRCDTWQ
jgi:hypothetical protein